VVFRKESKVDAFQRQISALRQQLGSEEANEEAQPYSGDAPDPQQPEERYDSGISYRARDVAGHSFATSAPSPQFATYEDESTSLPAVPTPEVDAQTSVVAHDTTWNGDLQTSGSLHVHGTVEGSLTAADDVYIAEEADVSATITAANVIVAGLVRGTIRCGSRFEVLPRGRVLADVHAPSLVVHEGATINGQVRMGAAEASAAEQPTPTVVHRRAARNRA
jgi:cytoskeletal protein CcmA (bactofilin family)